MIQVGAISARERSAAALHTADRRARSGADNSCIAGLEVQLSIDGSQMKAWAALAETLSANSRRLNTVDGVRDHPFGRLEDRLAALSSMRQAAAVLFSVLDAAPAAQGLAATAALLLADNMR